MAESNVLEQIRKKFKDSTTQICIRNLPHYISSFIQEDKEVIFICNEPPKYEKNIPILNHNGTCNGTSNIFDGDITGNPLEAPYSKFDTMNFSSNIELLDEENESNKHFPLSVIEARSILGYCSLTVKPSLPVWILTDGKDIKKFLLLSLYIEDAWITRSWVIELGLMVNPELNYLLSKHSKFSGRPLHMASCQGRCTYIVQKEAVLDDLSLLRSVISLQISWTTMTLEPTVSNRSTEVKLYTKVRVGHATGGLGVLWEQLCLLDKYLNLKSEINPNIFLPSCDEVMKFFTKKTRHDSPLLRVRSTLTEPVKSCDVHKEPVKSCDVHKDSEVSLNGFVELYLLNEDPSSITDRLWLLLVECKTATEVLSCLRSFHIELKKKDTPKPFVGANNITSLGGELLDGGRNMQDPIECLVEMGLEKLRKDLLQIFSNAQLATTWALNIPKLPNFGKITGADWMPAARKWHLWLCQVHCALEILVEIQNSLSLPNTALRSLLPDVLDNCMGKTSKIDSISSIIENPVQDVVSKISISHVHDILRKKPTEEWVFSLTTSTEFQKYHNTFFKSPWNNFPTIGNLNQGIDSSFYSSEPMYHWYEYGSISEYFSS